MLCRSVSCSKYFPLGWSLPGHSVSAVEDISKWPGILGPKFAPQVIATNANKKITNSFIVVRISQCNLSVIGTVVICSRLWRVFIVEFYRWFRSWHWFRNRVVTHFLLFQRIVFQFYDWRKQAQRIAHFWSNSTCLLLLVAQCARHQIRTISSCYFYSPVR